VDLLFQTSLGIDIQDESVSFAYLKASFKGIQLAAHAVYPLEKRHLLQEKVAGIGGLIRDFMAKNSVSPATIFLGMPRHAAILTYVQLPLAVKENLRESLGYEMEKYVPLPEGDIYFDYQIVLEDKESGNLKLLLVAARRETVDLYLDLAARIGVGISGIEIDSTALANYFSYRRDADWGDTCAIIYLRDGRLELDLLKGGFLDASRSVNRGEWGPDLSDLISHELQKLKDGVGERQGILSAVLCGVDASADLVEHFRGDEGLDIRSVDLSRRATPSFAMIPAYGLALKGILKLPTDINLLPEAVRKRPNKAGQYTMIALAGLLILLVLAWGGGVIVSQQLYLRELDARIARLGVEVANIEQTQAKCKEIEDRIDYLSALYRARTPVLETLKELSLRVPKTAWVRRLTLSGKEVTIDGLADAASELIPSLDGSALFRDVTFLSSISRRDASGKESFRIGLKLH
jgi:Tfp pilus assembly protein PilN